MKATTIIFAAISLLTGHAAADANKCKNHQFYCGHTLKSMKWSTGDIMDAVERSAWNDGHIPTWGEVDNSVFKCGSSGGALVWMNDRKPCPVRCMNAGSGNPDYCDGSRSDL